MLGTIVANRDPSNQVGQADTDPRPAVSFVTTGHFTLQAMAP